MNVPFYTTQISQQSLDKECVNMLKTASIIFFTQKGQEIGEHLKKIMSSIGYHTEISVGRGEHKVSLSQWTKEKFTHSQVLIFVGATGIAVRAIAPHIKSKITDPAVLVVDDNGHFCIPILSGHVGGANKVATQISQKLGATPVITTATDINGKFAVDTFAKEHNLVIVNPEKIKEVSAKLLDGKNVSIYSDFPVGGKLPSGVTFGSQKCADIIVSYKEYGNKNALILAPKVLAVGIGCRKNTPKQPIINAFDAVFKKQRIRKEAVIGVYSIDLKAKEQGLLDFCKTMELDFHTFTAEQLSGVEGEFSSSSFVKSVTGVDNVCERSAVLGCGGTLVCKKLALEGVTVALAKQDYKLRF